MNHQEYKEYLPKRLRQLRKELLNNCNQKAAAEKLGVNYKSYMAYELGVALPPFDILLKMSKGYGFKTVDEFVFGEVETIKKGCAPTVQLAYLKLKPQQKKIVDYILYENC